MVLEGSENGNELITTLLVKIKEVPEVREYQPALSPADVDSMLDDILLTEAMKFVTRQGSKVLIFQDSIAFIETRTTAGKIEKEQLSVEDKPTVIPLSGKALKEIEKKEKEVKPVKK